MCFELVTGIELGQGLEWTPEIFGDRVAESGIPNNGFRASMQVKRIYKKGS